MGGWEIERGGRWGWVGGWVRDGRGWENTFYKGGERVWVGDLLEIGCVG